MTWKAPETTTVFFEGEYDDMYDSGNENSGQVITTTSTESFSTEHLLHSTQVHLQDDLSTLGLNVKGSKSTTQNESQVDANMKGTSGTTEETSEQPITRTSFHQKASHFATFSTASLKSSTTFIASAPNEISPKILTQQSSVTTPSTSFDPKGILPYKTTHKPFDLQAPYILPSQKKISVTPQNTVMASSISAEDTTTSEPEINDYDAVLHNSISTIKSNTPYSKTKSTLTSQDTTMSSTLSDLITTTNKEATSSILMLSTTVGPEKNNYNTVLNNPTPSMATHFTLSANDISVPPKDTAKASIISPANINREKEAMHSITSTTSEPYKDGDDKRSKKLIPSTETQIPVTATTMTLLQQDVTTVNVTPGAVMSSNEKAINSIVTPSTAVDPDTSHYNTVSFDHRSSMETLAPLLTIQSTLRSQDITLTIKPVAVNINDNTESTQSLSMPSVTSDPNTIQTNTSSQEPISMTDINVQPTSTKFSEIPSDTKRTNTPLTSGTTDNTETLPSTTTLSTYSWSVTESHATIASEPLSIIETHVSLPSMKVSEIPLDTIMESTEQSTTTYSDEITLQPMISMSAISGQKASLYNSSSYKPISSMATTMRFSEITFPELPLNDIMTTTPTGSELTTHKMVYKVISKSIETPKEGQKVFHFKAGNVHWKTLSLNRTINTRFPFHTFYKILRHY